MPLPIETLAQSALRLWRSTSSNNPTLGRRYSIQEQVWKERETDRLMHDVETSTESTNTIPHDARKRLLAVRCRIQKSIVQLLHSFECVIDETMEQSFSRVTDEFIKRAYEFDSDITEEAVYQASRNVLIMNTFQMHLGKEICLTPSVFAYSMLYPYTDNYLDAASIDATVKRESNDWLLLRLAGIAVPVRTRRERIIDELVEMIEEEFDRRSYPQVFESLLAIHSAQTRSVAQQCNDLPPDELLHVSVEKGGTSVLADGYLVAGNLSKEDAEFFFDFGVLLQLIDDLQDIDEDARCGHRTLVNTVAADGALDDFTNRLLLYITRVLEPALHREQQLRVLIERSCRLLIFEAMACNKRYYGEDYLLRMEKHSPVRFDFLRKVKQRLQEQYSSHRAEHNYRRLGKHVNKLALHRNADVQLMTALISSPRTRSDQSS